MTLGLDRQTSLQTAKPSIQKTQVSLTLIKTVCAVTAARAHLFEQSGQEEDYLKKDPF